MKKIITVILFLSSILFSSEVLTFADLTELVSNDIGKNIYLDKNITNYNVEVNLVDHQKKGQLYEFYKIVLFDHDLSLEYNKRGNFYFVKKSNLYEAPKKLYKDTELHYYTYKIKNITNEDVVKSLSIFPNVKFKYLKQSDMLVYSANRSDHEQVEKILSFSDRSVLQKTIKITLFATNKKIMSNIGSTINSFSYNFDGKINNIIDALRTGTNAKFTLNDNVAIDFTLHALEGWSAVKISQAPTMILTNGIETSVNSVLNVPYLKTTSTVDSNTNSVTEQYDYKDIGLQIKILPKIKGDWVFLKLDLVSDELISLDDNKPITQKISYINSVKVIKGHPVLLTGIKKTTKHFERNGVPILSDIPILGELFKLRSKNDENQNINMLIEVL